MSYCRWAHPGCDLYCYADVNGGYTTHVTAASRVAHLPHCGETFHDITVEAFKTRLLQLAALGYEAPVAEILVELEEEPVEAPSDGGETG